MLHLLPVPDADKAEQLQTLSRAYETVHKDLQDRGAWPIASLIGYRLVALRDQQPPKPKPALYHEAT